MIKVIIELEFDEAPVEKEHIYERLEELIFNGQLIYTQHEVKHNANNHSFQFLSNI